VNVRTIVVAVWAMFAASSAAAQGFSLDDDAAPLESPRSAFLELKFSGYRPLDRASVGLLSPYVGDRSMLLAELEYERQIYRGIGAASVGFSLGYGELFARARTSVGDGTSVTAAESTGLRIFPLRLLGVYRFDWLARTVGVPLIPFVKAGLVGIPWSMVKGGKLEVVNGVAGQSASFGYQGTGGLALELDFLSPRMARDFDASMGVNHSFLFAEFTYASVDNFGQAAGLGGVKTLSLTSRGFVFGFGMEL
jgi:hypothetical protein